MSRDENQGIVGDASTERLRTGVEDSLPLSVLRVTCSARLILVVVDEYVPSDL